MIVISKQEKTTSTAPAQKLSKRNLWTFPLGTIGRDMGGSLFSNYLLTYVLFTKTLTEAQFAAMSIIMVVVQVFDALNDPIMGNVLEVTRTRIGKFKPWIIAGTLSSAVVFYISFSNTLQGWNYVVLFSILYFAYSITFTMNDIAYWGMIPSLASSAKDRNKLTSMTALCAGAGSFLTTLIVPPFTAGENVIGGNAITGYRILAILMCSLFIATPAITIFGVKEQPLPKTRSINKVGPRTVFNTLKKNDQLVWAAVLFLIHSVGNMLVTGGLSVSYLYFEFGYNGMYLTLFTVIGGAAGAIMTMFYSFFSSRFTRNQLVRFASFSAILGYAIMLAVGLFVPNSIGMAKFLMICVGNLFAFSGQITVYMIMVICIANTVEYNEWKTGSRDEGIIFSVRPFITKLSTSIVQLMVMVIYFVVGVRKVTNQISDLENQASAGLIDATEKAKQIGSILTGVSSGKTAALLLCMTVIPALFATTAYVIYKKKFKITEARYDELLAEIAQRKATEDEDVQ